MPEFIHFQIAVSLLALTCGSVLFWRRRDNVLGYIQGAAFLSTLVVPLFGTSAVKDADPSSVQLYANVLTLGACCYLIGLAAGAPFGTHARRSLPLLFGPLRSVGDNMMLVVRRARVIGLAGVVALAGSYYIIGYVPLFAADRTAAKYGIGVYRPGFLRGSIFFHIALTIASTIIPVLLVILYRRRRTPDMLVTGLLALGLVATLSRTEALIGPLLFLVALAVHRKFRAVATVALVALTYLGGTLANELLLPDTTDSTKSLAARVADGAPDIRDHVGFVTGFLLTGGEHVGVKPIATFFSVRKGYYDPAAYAIRTLTGISDTSEIASGGIRLPAPVWGYASYGFLGAAVWSFISGFFAGWGTTLIRRMLTRRDGSTAPLMDLILGATFYIGTFGVLEAFYFPQRSGVIAFAVAVAVCVSFRTPGPDDRSPPPLPGPTVVRSGRVSAR